MTDYEGSSGDDCGADDERVLKWQIGLPTSDDLTPLSHLLIPPELASAFSISPEPSRTHLDVNRASQNTVSSLRGGGSQAFSSKVFRSLNNDRSRDPMVVEGDEETVRDRAGSDSRKVRKIDCAKEADSALRTENSTDDPSNRALKRPRLVWTPQLHKRFVDVVAHLGIKNAVPKTIMQMMNVQGLTRENVASHLQKYRLYLKRMQGISSEDPSLSDQFFASTPVPQSLHESGGSGHSHRNMHLPVSIPMPYPPTMMPMQMLGMPHGDGHLGISLGNHGFESDPHNMLQQRDWSAYSNKYAASVVSYPPNDK